MKYIGNKTRLLPFIEHTITSSGISLSGTFIDIFGGTGSVGKHFKDLGMQVISNDIMTYSYVFQQVLIRINQVPSFDKLKLGGLEQVLNWLNQLPGIKGYVFENFAPSGKFGRQYFSDTNAMRIDAVREQIALWQRQQLLSEDEHFILLASLINAADFVANISGTYGAYLKIWRSMALKPLTLLYPYITDNHKNNQVFQQDANTLIRQIKGDILYLDPPYNARQYAPNFHVLETLAVWDKQPLNGKTGQRPYEDKKSLYCYKTKATEALKDLVQNADVKYILLSYNNEGIIPREDILKILATKGKVRELCQDYRRFRTEQDNEKRHYKPCDDKVVEHLYVVEVQ